VHFKHQMKEWKKNKRCIVDVTTWPGLHRLWPAGCTRPGDTFLNSYCKRPVNGVLRHPYLLTWVVRPPDVVGLGLIFYSRYFFFLPTFSSSATLGAQPTELNQTLPHVGKWAIVENACLKFGVPAMLKNMHKTTNFETTSQLTGTATLRGLRKAKDNKTLTMQNDLKTTNIPLNPPKISWTLIYKRQK